MLLGEALSLRARQANKLDDLRGRIRANALTQEGSEAAEDPVALLAEFDELSEEHAGLLYRIAITNATTDVDGEPLLKKLHRREHLRRRRNMANSAANTATPQHDRFTRYTQTELRYVPQFTVTDLRNRVDSLDNELRALDAQIQEANWQTELL